MKKNIFLAVIAMFICGFVFAQVTTTPEVPRNYKPKPKELLPMPDSLTNGAIFPVLGRYNVVNKNGDSSTVFISLDSESKGVVWLSGLSEGKFKAELKASPATYKIPSQKTYFNDEQVEESTVVDATAVETTTRKPLKSLSGKSVGEGTLIYDKESNTIYINLGSNFNEKNPSAIFEGMVNSNTMTDDTEGTAAKKTKKPAAKGKNYTGSKVIETPVASTM